LVVEIGEELFGVVVHVIGLFKQTRTEKIIEDLSEFWVLLEVADVLLFDGVFDGGEVRLEFGVEVFVILHMIEFLLFINFF
jgi:hypothetical protein